MAKVNAPAKKMNKIDVENLSERDRDFLSLDTAEVMKKYQVEKQSVYDRRFALNKKIKQLGLTLESVLNSASAPTPVEEPSEKAAAKKTRAKSAKPKQPKQEENVLEEKEQSSVQDMVPYNKPVPVIMKPIEINFETFSIKLNGVPKKISVNPETNSIEIDL